MNSDCLAMAALLRAGSFIAMAGHVAAYIGFTSHRRIALFLWPLTLYFALRVFIDARLFQWLAADPDTRMRELDATLVRWKLRKPSPVTRPLADRLQGARRLFKGLMIATGVQLAALFLPAW